MRERDAHDAVRNAWGALGTRKDEKRRLALEDAGRRIRRSGAGSGTFAQVSETGESDVGVELELALRRRVVQCCRWRSSIDGDTALTKLERPLDKLGGIEDLAIHPFVTPEVDL
jgi:hypothetical protein